MLFPKNSPCSCHSIKIPAQPCLSILLIQKKLPTYLTPGAFLQPIWAYFSGKHASNCRKWNALPPKLQVFLIPSREITYRPPHFFISTEWKRNIDSRFLNFGLKSPGRGSKRVLIILQARYGDDPLNFKCGPQLKGGGAFARKRSQFPQFPFPSHISQRSYAGTVSKDGFTRLRW